CSVNFHLTHEVRRFVRSEYFVTALACIVTRRARSAQSGDPKDLQGISVNRITNKLGEVFRTSLRVITGGLNASESGRGIVRGKPIERKGCAKPAGGIRGNPCLCMGADSRSADRSRSRRHVRAAHALPNYWWIKLHRRDRGAASLIHGNRTKLSQ